MSATHQTLTPAPTGPDNRLNAQNGSPESDEGNCTRCTDRKQHGWQTGTPFHCHTCHSDWTGQNAQHCTGCHRTFSSISAADSHRWKRPKGEPNGVCLDPVTTDGWHEKRPNVWTYGTWQADPFTSET